MKNAWTGQCSLLGISFSIQSVGMSISFRPNLSGHRLKIQHVVVEADAWKNGLSFFLYLAFSCIHNQSILRTIGELVVILAGVGYSSHKIYLSAVFVESFYHLVQTGSKLSAR